MGNQGGRIPPLWIPLGSFPTGGSGEAGGGWGMVPILDLNVFFLCLTVVAGGLDLKIRPGKMVGTLDCEGAGAVAFCVERYSSRLF